ncbi:MAG: hypothetical protein M0Z75_10895 [Nitrospiraceae bacterium]|nr:hypothetical protein [Nitrospiraceae bacterium]
MRKAAGFLIFACILAMALLPGCQSGLFGSNKSGDTPRGLLDRYFSSAMRKDYAASYECYYAAYKAKISKADYVKHRDEDPAALKDYKILSLRQTDDTALANVALTFVSARRPDITKPVSIDVKENLVREGGKWRIKVW